MNERSAPSQLPASAFVVSETARPCGSEWDPKLIELYRTEFDNLVKLARRLLDTTSLSEEAVQESFVKCHRARFPPAPGKELSYLRSVVLNTARSILRKRMVSDAWRPTTRRTDPSTEAEWLEMLHTGAVRDALTELPLRQRQVLVYRHVVGYSERETAAALAISVGAVKTHGSRGRQALQRGGLAALVA